MNTQGSVSHAYAVRVRAVRLVEEDGWSTADAAKAVGRTRRAVQQWLKKVRGADGDLSVLATGKRTGAPPKLNDEQRAELVRLLEAGPVACGFTAQIWTGPRVAELIRREFGVSYHDRFVPTLLQRIGFSRQKPKRRAVERDEERIATWVREDWPRIKKSRDGSEPLSSGSTNRAS
jgi:transposase